MRFFRCVAISLLGIAAPASGDDAALLQSVISQHRAARESIRTLAADYEYKTVKPNESVLASGQYRRTPKTVFITNSGYGTGSIDLLVRDGEVRGVGKGRTRDGQVEYSGVRASPAKNYSFGEVWFSLVLSTNGPAGAMMSYDELYMRAKRPPQASRETFEGRDCVKVRVAYDLEGVSGPVEINDTVWHDVQRNYLVLRHESTQVGYDVLQTAQIVEFQEPTPGVFVPVKCLKKGFDKSKLVGESEVSIRNVQVNTDISEQSLTLPKIPHGMLVSDRIKEQHYTVDSNWNQIGPATHMPTMGMQTVLPVGDQFGGPSESEPPGLPQWVMLAAVAVFAVAVLWFVGRLVLRRIKAKKTPPSE